MTRPGGGPRVVSLVPSVTETLLAWGVTPVAVTRFCEQPRLPAVGGTKDPDVAAVVALAPDLVVVCEEENRRQDAEALVAAGLEVLALRIDALADVGPALDALAARIGRTVGDDLRGRWTDDGPPPLRSRAFVPIWRRPWMSLGARCYGTSLLAALGVEVVVPAGGTRYPVVELDDVAALGPDVVLAPSEPFPFGRRHVAELSSVAPVVLVDGQDLFWWGVRTPAAVGRLAARLADVGLGDGERFDRRSAGA